MMSDWIVDTPLFFIIFLFCQWLRHLRASPHSFVLLRASETVLLDWVAGRSRAETSKIYRKVIQRTFRQIGFVPNWSNDFVYLYIVYTYSFGVWVRCVSSHASMVSRTIDRLILCRTVRRTYIEYTCCEMYSVPMDRWNAWLIKWLPFRT